MAKTPTDGAAKGKKRGGTARSAKPAPRKAKGTGSGKSAGAGKSAGSGKSAGAGEVLTKLLESPLVADLLAVGASAALAVVSERGFRKAPAAGGRSTNVIKEAGKAAASAMGRRLSSEVDEIRKASKKPKA